MRGSAKYCKALARLDRARWLAFQAQQDMREAIASHVGEDAARELVYVRLANGDMDPMFYWPASLAEAVERAVRDAADAVEGGAG